MANDIGPYNPIFYAQEALIQLEEALGMAGAVFRDYDKDPAQPGDTIRVRKPGTFTSQTMPITTAADLDPSELDITLDQWEGVAFSLRDDELNFAEERIIQEHIRPAAFAVAKSIDDSCNGLFTDIPHIVSADDTDPYKDFTATARTMRDNNVPDEQRFYEIGGEREEAYLNTSLFHEADKAADGAADVQLRGRLGSKFGFNTFVNQNIPSHTAGAATLGSGSNFVVDSAAAVGDTSLTIGDDGDDAIGGDVHAGDVITVDSTGESYAVTEQTDLSGATAVPITPAVRTAISADEAVTITQDDATVNPAFHRNAFALAMAPLSDVGNRLGARVETIADPKTRLALRSTMWYEEKDAELWIRLDALWGVKTLDPDLAVRVEK